MKVKLALPQFHPSKQAGQIDIVGETLVLSYPTSFLFPAIPQYKKKSEHLQMYCSVRKCRRAENEKQTNLDVNIWSRPN